MLIWCIDVKITNIAPSNQRSSVHPHLYLMSQPGLHLRCSVLVLCVLLSALVASDTCNTCHLILQGDKNNEHAEERHFHSDDYQVDLTDMFGLAVKMQILSTTCREIRKTLKSSVQNVNELCSNDKNVAYRLAIQKSHRWYLSKQHEHLAGISSIWQLTVQITVSSQHFPAAVSWSQTSTFTVKEWFWYCLWACAMQIRICGSRYRHPLDIPFQKNDTNHLNFDETVDGCHCLFKTRSSLIPWRCCL